MPSTANADHLRSASNSRSVLGDFIELNYLSISLSIPQILRQKENSIEIFALDTLAEMNIIIPR